MQEPTEEDLTNTLQEQPTLDELKYLDQDDLMGVYLQEISQIPLLTPDEEIRLSKQYQAGYEARQAMLAYLDEPMPDEVKQELVPLIIAGWNAKDALITANTRLVVSVAKKYTGHGLELLDLIQNGNIGLIRATKKFDMTRGHRFSTYATWWIRQAIGRSISDQGRAIRIPVKTGDTIRKMRAVTNRLRQELGRTPTTEDIANAMDIPLDKVNHYESIATVDTSLNETKWSDDEAELGDTLADVTEHSITQDEATQNILRKTMHNVLHILSPREREVLTLRYGLSDGGTHTLEEAGRILGVTRERVRQIEFSALSKLRRPSVGVNLHDFLD